MFALAAGGGRGPTTGRIDCWVQANNWRCRGRMSGRRQALPPRSREPCATGRRRDGERRQGFPPTAVLSLLCHCLPCATSSWEPGLVRIIWQGWQRCTGGESGASRTLRYRRFIAPSGTQSDRMATLRALAGTSCSSLRRPAPHIIGQGLASSRGARLALYTPSSPLTTCSAWWQGLTVSGWLCPMGGPAMWVLPI